MFMAVAVIFGLSGLIGGAYAPIIAKLSASTGAHNKVVANYNIKSLPKQQLLLGTSFHSAGIPDMGGGKGVGNMRLYRIESSGAVEVKPTIALTWATVTADSHGRYDYLGQYEWRFYETGIDATDNPDRFVHKHIIQVFQETYSFEIPKSARDSYSDGKISFIPNVTVPGMAIRLPLPSKFIDRNGNDLFDNETEKVEDLREDVLRDMTGFTGVTNTDRDAAKAATADGLEKFKAAIFNKTNTRFYGTAFDGYASGSIRDIKTDANRTYVPIVPGDNYYVEYDFDHPKIGAKFRTEQISVEYTGLNKDEIRGVKKDGDPNNKADWASDKDRREKQIRFDFPAKFDQTQSANAMKFKEYFTLPIPTVELTKGTETDATKNDFQPVKFSRATSVTSYTYITVRIWNTGNTEYPASTVYTGDPLYEGKKISEIIIDESTGYKFRPTLPGTYAFLYHTTTFFGTGFTGHFPTDSTNEMNHVSELNGFVRYYPHNLFRITTNEVSPELKWSVPFKYVVDKAISEEEYNAERHIKYDDGVVIGGKVLNAANFPDIKIGDAIAVTDNALFDVKAGDILERNDEKRHWEKAPNLEKYLPSGGFTPLTQISDREPLVIPALLGFNNVDKGSKLQYIINITRYENGGNPTSISFDSKRTAANTTTSFKYDHTKELVIGFDAPVDGSNGTVGETYAKKNGYGDGGYLASWKNKSKYQQYRIEVSCIDNSYDHFDNTRPGAPSSSMNYSFNLVKDERHIVDGNNDYLMHAQNPEFNGRLYMMQTTYYENDTLTFQQISVTDEYTTDVQVKYYLLWNNNPADAIELDENYLKNGTFSFSLRESNRKAQKMLAELNTNAALGGILNLNIVAVARNFYSLSNSIGNDFQPLDNPLNGTATNGNAIFTMTDLIRYVDDPRSFVKPSGAADDVLAKRVMTGMAVEVFPIKMFSLEYGESASIGMRETSGTPVGAALATQSNFWKDKYTDGSGKSTVFQNSGVVGLPTMTFGYAASAENRTFITTVEFSMILPVRKESVGILGGTTQTISIKEGETRAITGYSTNDELGLLPNELNPTRNGLRFYPEEIGIHTFVARVYNGGGFVSIFTAQINVVGKPTTVPILKGGVDTLRIAQRGNLPSVEVRIDGKEFETDGFGNILAAYAPYEILVWKPDSTVDPDDYKNPAHVDYGKGAYVPEKWEGFWGNASRNTYHADPNKVPAHPDFWPVEDTPSILTKDDYLHVGTYTIKADAVGGGIVPSTIGNYFIPAAADKYIFTYELDISGLKLNNLNISAHADYSASIAHEIIVTELQDGDIGIGFDPKAYTDLLSATQYKDGSVNKPLAVGENNILSQMASTSARDINMGLTQLNSAMIPAVDKDGATTGITDPRTGTVKDKHGNDVTGIVGWDDDIYDFGRVYLPNMYAEWAEGLSALYDFNLPEASRVTVAHSKKPNEPLFDSKLIPTASNPDQKNPENKFVDASNSTKSLGRYYYFKPSGSIYVAKPKFFVSTDSDAYGYISTAGFDNDGDRNNAEWNAPSPKDYYGPAGVIKYYWDRSAQKWWFMDYNNPDYVNEKYGHGKGRPVDPSVTPDGIYNVTYTITWGGITSTVEFKIGVGDTAVPIIEFAKGEEDKLFGSSYKKDKEFRINTSDSIRVNPNGGTLTDLDSDGTYARWYVAKNMKVSVLRPGGMTDIPVGTEAENLHKIPVLDDDIIQYKKAKSGDDPNNIDNYGYLLEDGKRVVEKDGVDNRTWQFKLAESGDYRITFQIESESGQVGYLTRTITVDAPKGKTAVSPQTIWGTILIVISSGLLLAVIVYFIQTGRKTKFASKSLKGKSAKGAKDGGDGTTVPNADGAIV